MKPKRIIFYSHDTFGLGHIRRTQKIANELAGPDTAILIICSSPKASEYKSQKGIEYLNLPGFTKLQSGRYIPRNLNLSIEEFVEIRSQLILAAVQSFDPEVLVVDKEPLGVKGELKKTLEYLRRHRPDARTVCGIRDILDQPEQVKAEWEKRGSREALRKFYDGILVYGDKDIYDLEEQYSLDKDLAQKLQYVGYILETVPEDLRAGASNSSMSAAQKLDQCEDQRSEGMVSGEADHDGLKNCSLSAFDLEVGQKLPLVTFSLGGGEDGYAFLQTYIEMLKRYRDELPFYSKIITGPFLQNGEFHRSEEEVGKLKDVASIENFVPNMVELFAKSHGLVTMGGYNTFCECMALNKVPLIIPRIVPRKEQLIRAEIFSELGFCHYIHPNDLSPDNLYEKVVENLRLNRQTSMEMSEGRGLEKTAGYLSELLGSVHLRRHGWIERPTLGLESVNAVNDQVYL